VTDLAADRERTIGSYLLPTAARLVPGIGRVQAQIVPFARAWREANADAMQQSGPLWVALGDSMSQGVGARTIAGGWVGQLHCQLAAAGRPMRLVNLSVTGARTEDLVREQIPQLRALGVTPDLVTVLVGANDMLTRRRRIAAVAQFAALIAELDGQSAAIAALPRRNREALEINASLDAAAKRGAIRVADTRGARSLSSWRGALADDHFHPNELGYASIAKTFAAAIDLD
jgi:acyl-CoA thioesterase-1